MFQKNPSKWYNRCERAVLKISARNLHHYFPVISSVRLTAGLQLATATLPLQPWQNAAQFILPAKWTVHTDCQIKLCALPTRLFVLFYSCSYPARSLPPLNLSTDNNSLKMATFHGVGVACVRKCPNNSTQLRCFSDNVCDRPLYTTNKDFFRFVSGREDGESGWKPTWESIFALLSTPFYASEK